MGQYFKTAFFIAVVYIPMYWTLCWRLSNCVPPNVRVSGTF